MFKFEPVDDIADDVKLTLVFLGVLIVLWFQMRIFFPQEMQAEKIKSKDQDTYSFQMVKKNVRM